MSLTPDDIVREIAGNLSGEFESLIGDNIEQVPEIEDVISWIQQSKEALDQGKRIAQAGRDEALSDIANKMVGQLIQHVPTYMGQLIVDNIKISTEGKEKGVTFDMAFVLDPFKPYVEIVKKINHVDSVKITVEFQIDSDVKLSGNRLTLDGQNRSLALGVMVIHILIAMSSSAGPITDERTLKEFEFEIDLSNKALQL